LRGGSDLELYAHGCRGVGLWVPDTCWGDDH
jgi:hypothetical protein